MLTKCVAAFLDLPFSPAVVITEFTPVFMSHARLRASEFGEGGLRPNLHDPIGKQVPGRVVGLHQLREIGYSEVEMRRQLEG